MPRLYLVDGSSYVYRAFYAIRSLATTQGLPTNAVYGFTTMLLKVLKTHEPDALAVVFDAPGRTFRDDLFKEYKATRQATPEDLVRQLPFIREVAPALGIETFEVPGVEADDVIGTLAVQALEKGWDVRIVTADKDFMQLVTKRAEDPQPGITLYDDFRERIVGVDEVVEKFGVPPEQVVDVLALVGDTSDNIPGVSGIGPKFAADLVREFGSVEAILKDLSKVKPRFRAALENGREDAALSKRLATIRRDLDVAFDPARFARRAPDRERLAKLFGRLEFQKLMQQIDLEGERTSTFDVSGYRLVLDRPALEALAGELSTAETIAFRVEVSDPDPMRAEIVGLAFCAREGSAAYVPLGHRYLGAPAQLPAAEALEVLRPALTADRPRKVGQATTADAVVLARHGVEVRPLAFDTMVGAWLLDSDRGPFTLEAVARKFLGHDTIPAEDVTGTGKGRIAFDQVPVDRARDSSGERAEAVFRLAPRLERRAREDGLGRVLDEIEIPLLPVLADLQRSGVRVDTAYLQSLAREFERRMMAAVQDVHRLAGEEFNLDSPKQLQRILFDKLKLNPGKRTKTGFSTDVSVLERLAGKHALPSRLLEYRMLSKLKSTYIDALPALVNPATGRIHTSYNQAVAATGRLSSSDPNLQNIPVRTAEGRLIRKAFVPAPGRVLVSADYSQVELRVLAHVSGDERLSAAFREGRDVHAATAQEVFGDVSDESRRRAKAINFGIVYGMSAFGLSQRLDIPPAEAESYIGKYFDRYPGVKAWLERTIEEGRRQGYVTTLFGRRRYVPDLQSQNRILSGAAERVAVNAPIQGTAADLMKRAMVSVWRRLRGTGALLILQVHDELVLEAPEGGLAEAERAVREEMENVHPLAVPLKVDVSRGPNWADLA